MSLMAYVLALLLTLPILAGIRWLMGRRLRALMRRKSGSEEEPLAEFRETPERPALGHLDTRVLDAASMPDDLRTARREAIKIARRPFNRLSLTEFICVFLMLIAGSVLAQPFFPPDDPSLVARIALGYVLFVVIRFFAYRRHYERVTGKKWLARTRLVLGRSAFAGLLFVVHPRIWGLVFAIYAAGILYAAATEHSPALVLAALVLVALHAALRWLVLRKAQSLPNTQLLILRTFGMTENAYLTFGALLTSWRHFGLNFTVVDPSHFRYRFRGVSETNVEAVFWVTVFFLMCILAVVLESQGVPLTFDALVAEAQKDAPELLFAAPLTAVALTLSYLAALLVRYVAAPRAFTRDHAQIVDWIARMQRRPRQGLVFRNAHIYCYDNTWRTAVAEFVAHANVVLMDLRGYSERKRGCEYEVDFLLDTEALDHIVFLTDEETGTEAVETLLEERWAELRETSPNLKEGVHTARVYVSTTGKAKDVAGLLDLLLDAATPVEDTRKN